MKKNRICLLIFLLSFFLFSLVSTEKSFSICKGPILNPITDVDWMGVFPVTVATIPIGKNGSYMIEPPSPLSTPICICPFPPPVFFRIGISFGMWEPAHLVEVVKDPFCFPSLGPLGALPKIVPGLQGGGGRSSCGKTGNNNFQAHIASYPVWSLMKLFLDFVCVTPGVVELTYLSELDPFWQKSTLAALLNPEALLFANPIAQLACIPDAISSQIGLPLSPLFWCMGSSGSLFPLIGKKSNSEMLQTSMAIAGRAVFKGLRQGDIYDTGTIPCSPGIPTPIWNKWNFRYQLAKPMRGLIQPLGRSSNIWGVGANPPTGGPSAPDNFTWIIFKRRVCCAF